MPLRGRIDDPPHWRSVALSWKHGVSFAAMTIDDQIKQQLLNVIQTIRPYAHAPGQFHDASDLRAAIKLALQYLERAELLARKM
jgi:hypothetical protein